jgi:hypothetical protein
MSQQASWEQFDSSLGEAATGSEAGARWPQQSHAIVEDWLCFNLICIQFIRSSGGGGGGFTAALPTEWLHCRNSPGPGQSVFSDGFLSQAEKSQAGCCVNVNSMLHLIDLINWQYLHVETHYRAGTTQY